VHKIFFEQENAFLFNFGAISFFNEPFAVNGKSAGGTTYQSQRCKPLVNELKDLNWRDF